MDERLNPAHGIASDSETPSLRSIP